MSVWSERTVKLTGKPLRDYIAEHFPTFAMDDMERVLLALHCAEADLQGILPDYDPDGTHPAKETLRELAEAIRIVTPLRAKEVRDE
jgi:NAD(P)H-dependent FMN reductase